MYGPDGVFFKLAQLCVEFKADKYVYSVCPFRAVKQKDVGREALLIGEQVRWLQQGPNDFKLLLDNGSNQGCPQSQSRRTTVIT